MNKSDVEYKKNFIPSISISELNIKIKNPSGNLLNFMPNKINNEPNKLIYNSNINEALNNTNDEPDKINNIPNKIDHEPNKLIYSTNINNELSEANNRPCINHEPNNFTSINFIFEIKYRKNDNTTQLFD